MTRGGEGEITKIQDMRYKIQETITKQKSIIRVENNKFYIFISPLEVNRLSKNFCLDKFPSKNWQ